MGYVRLSLVKVMGKLEDGAVSASFSANCRCKNDHHQRKTMRVSRICAATLAVAIVAGCSGPSKDADGSKDRWPYQLIPLQDQSAYRLDRQTGEVVLYNLDRVYMVDPGGEMIRLPQEELAKIDGRLGINTGGFLKGTIYNGSRDWYVSNIVVSVNLSKKAGKETKEFFRLLSIPRNIAPLSTEDVAINSGLEDDLTKGFKFNGWSLDAAYGRVGGLTEWSPLAP